MIPINELSQRPLDYVVKEIQEITLLSITQLIPMQTKRVDRNALGIPISRAARATITRAQLLDGYRILYRRILDCNYICARCECNSHLPFPR